MSETPKITREQLTELLKQKIAAQAIFHAAARLAEKAPIEEKIDLDIAYKLALHRSCAADRAYDEALDAYTAQGAE